MNRALMFLLLDDVTSGVVETSTNGCTVNCSVVYRGLHKPEIHLINAHDTTVQTDNSSSSFVQNTPEYNVFSAMFDVSASEHSFCQISLPLYRCNELSSVYTRTFAIQRQGNVCLETWTESPRATASGHGGMGEVIISDL